MTTDIVHTLRHRPTSQPFVPLGHQAADEIERLRKVNLLLAAAIRSHVELLDGECDCWKVALDAHDEATHDR